MSQSQSAEVEAGPPHQANRPLSLLTVTTLFPNAVQKAHGVFVETHPRPDTAPSDGPNMIALDDLPALISSCTRIRDAVVGSPGETTR